MGNFKLNVEVNTSVIRWREKVEWCSCTLDDEVIYFICAVTKNILLDPHCWVLSIFYIRDEEWLNILCWYVGISLKCRCVISFTSMRNIISWFSDVRLLINVVRLFIMLSLNISCFLSEFLENFPLLCYGCRCVCFLRLLVWYIYIYNGNVMILSFR